MGFQLRLRLADSSHSGPDDLVHRDILQPRDSVFALARVAYVLNAGGGDHQPRMGCFLGQSL